MTKRTVVAAILWVVALNSLARAQVADPSVTPITINVIVSGVRTGTPAADSNKVSVATEANGKFSVDARTSQPEFPPECPSPATAETQRVGTRVEGTVESEPDGRFRVNFTITQRTVAGCRSVGGLTIPVFSNTIISRTAVVVRGEVIPLGVIEEPGGDTLKLEMALSSEK